MKANIVPLAELHPSPPRSLSPRTITLSLLFLQFLSTFTSLVYLLSFSILPLFYLSLATFCLLVCLTIVSHLKYPISSPVTLVHFTVLLALLITCTISTNYITPDLNHNFHTVTVGHITDTTAKLWVRSPQSPEACLTLRPGDTGGDVTECTTVKGDSDYTGVINFANLTPDTHYAGATASFRTLPTAPSNLPLAFIAGSCTMLTRTVATTLPGLSSISAHNPQFVLFLGDLIYADVPHVSAGLDADLHLYRAMYRATLADPHFAALSQSTSMYYMVDDHELINDYNGYNDTVLYENAMQVSGG